MIAMTTISSRSVKLVGWACPRLCSDSHGIDPPIESATAAGISLSRKRL